MNSEDEIEIPIKELKINNTPVKAKKTRTMTPDMLEKLALAREAAKLVQNKNSKFTKMKNDIKKQEKIDKKDAIVKKHEEMFNTSKKELKAETLKKELKEEPVKIEEEIKEEVEEEPEKEPEKELKEKPIKKKLKKKPIVIVQESSDDSDDDNQVIYIKRKSKKKIIPEILEQHNTPALQRNPVLMNRPVNPFHQYNQFNKYF